MLTYGSVCSGIEAASVAWHPLGWKATWLAEIEAFPSAVLAHHYPDVPNLGDMTKISRMVLVGDVAAPDVLVGGTPCQAFSVAGMREGLADERGQLTMKYVELADAVDFIRGRTSQPPAIVVWENVPGVLSSKDNAFGCFLGGLAGESCELQPPGGKWPNAGCVLGPARTIAWRVLDAQYFGVAQRRRRVFVVASARKDFDPAKVLFEFEGVRRDTAPSREAAQNTTAGTLRSTDGGSCVDHACAGHLIAGTLQANGKAAGSATQQDAESGLLVPVQCVTGDITHTLKAEGFDASEDGAGRGQPIVTVLSVHGTQDPDIRVDHAHTLGRNSGQENAVLAFSCKDYGADAGEISPTLRAMGHAGSHANAGGQVAVAYRMAVRRLTPTECERLQGFPEGYTRIPARPYKQRRITNLRPADMWEKIECGWMLMSADGPRYKAIGNSKAIPVVRWIGSRIATQLSKQATSTVA